MYHNTMKVFHMYSHVSLSLMSIPPVSLCSISVVSNGSGSCTDRSRQIWRRKIDAVWRVETSLKAASTVVPMVEMRHLRVIY